MLQQKFYHNTTRKAVIAFGNLFNNIHIDRRNSSNVVVQTLKVPLAYAPKQKFLARIESMPNPDERKVEVVLPRMAFELTSINYDPARKVSPVLQNRITNNSSTSLNSQYAPAPYNLDMSLYIYAKNQDDGLQIIEQILPYFNPDFNLSLNAIPELGIKNDLPILLNSITYDDQYEGDFSTRQAIIWTLSFTLKMNYFGPISRTSIIRTAIANTFSDPTLSTKESEYTVTVNPGDAVPGDVINFVEDFKDF